VVPVTVSRDHVFYAFSPALSPVVRVRQGEEVILETHDCFGGQLQSEADLVESLDWARINPATGPVYFEGARPGDILRVDLLELDVPDRSTMVTIPGEGVLGDVITQMETAILTLEQGHVVFKGKVRIPKRPMIGVIGVAPAEDSVPNGTPGAHGGNMDCTLVGQGARVYFTVGVEGALLGCGDMHTVMGDGEIVVCILVVPDVGAVQQVHHFAVNAAWGNAEIAPDFLARLGRTAEVGRFFALGSELLHRLQCHVSGDLHRAAILGCHAQKARNFAEFALVADSEIRRFALGGGQQREHKIAPVIRVSGRPHSDHAGEVARGNGLYRSPADTRLARLHQAARAHVAMLAARADVPDGTGLHRLGAAECRCDFLLLRVLQQGVDCGINALDGSHGLSSAFCSVSAHSVLPMRTRQVPGPCSR